MDTKDLKELCSKNIERMENGIDRDRVAGPILIEDYAVKIGNQGNEYIAGNFRIGNKYAFKIWGSSKELMDEFKSSNLNGCVLMVQGRLNIYNDFRSLIIESVTSELVNVDKSIFYEQHYNIDAYWEGFKNQIEKQLSDKGKKIVFKIFEDKAITDRFKIEFAASRHHDSFVGGLMAHTYKMLRIYNVLRKIYKNIDNNIDRDLIPIGIIIHDIGKIYEYNMGVYTQDGFVTHRVFGIELLSKYKDDIIEEYNVMFYRRLQAIISQHHGEWGERPKTVEALVIHMIDNFESQMQDIDQALKDNEGLKNSYIQIGDYKLQ